MRTAVIQEYWPWTRKGAVKKKFRDQWGDTPPTAASVIERIGVLTRNNPMTIREMATALGLRYDTVRTEISRKRARNAIECVGEVYVGNRLMKTYRYKPQR